jgi:hypothetical protein
MTGTTINLLVDGIAFQLDQSGVAHIWRALLPQLASRLKSITLLDRGNSPEVFGIKRIPFPAYTNKATAAESILIDKLCVHYRADIFTSTGHSTPLCTPMLLLIDDFIFDGFDEFGRESQEKELAILYSKRRVCLSEEVRRELLRRYPGLNRATISVAEVGGGTSLQDSECNLNPLVDHLVATCTELSQEARSGVHDDFVRRWSELRRIQADVDI